MDLIAEGPEPQQRWKIPLQSGIDYVLGRNPGGPLAVPWDSRVSRRHARIRLEHDTLHVERLVEARNPLFWDGQAVEQCTVRDGDHFVLGSTSFHLAGEISAAGSSPVSPVGEMTFSRQALQKVRFRDADRRIEVLSHLPEVIWGARSDADLFLRVGNLLLAGIVQAEAVAIVALQGENLQILH